MATQPLAPGPPTSSRSITRGYGPSRGRHTGLLIGGVGVTLEVGAFIGVKIGQFFFCPKAKK